MEEPPLIPPQNSPRAGEFRSRCIVAILIGAIGFWGPLWYDSRLPLYGDSRLGMVFIFTLPFIIAAGIWAMCAFSFSHRPRFVSAVLLLMVWSPVLFVGFGIIRTIFSLANR